MRRIFSKGPRPPKSGSYHCAKECHAEARSLIESDGGKALETISGWIPILEKEVGKEAKELGNVTGGYFWTKFSFSVFQDFWKRGLFREAYQFLSRIPARWELCYDVYLEAYAREGDMKRLAKLPTKEALCFAPPEESCQVSISLNRVFLILLQRNERKLLDDFVKRMDSKWTYWRSVEYPRRNCFGVDGYPLDQVRAPVTLRRCMEASAFADYKNRCLEDTNIGEFVDHAPPSSFRGVWERCQSEAAEQLRVAHNFFFGVFTSPSHDRAARWAKTALEGKLTPDQTLEAELILEKHTKVRAMSSEEVEKERIRLEFEFKKWEKERELAHQERLARIEAEKEKEKFKLQEEGKIKALEKEAELKVNEVLETHDKVVGTLQLQVEKNNAEAEKYKALLDLQEQRKNEGKSELADVLKILEQLKNDG